jgi:hypothetical protein
MNERLQQLAKQAHFYQADDNYFTAAQEEFARLIVRECVDQLRQEWYDLNNTESDTPGDARAVAILVGQKNGVLKTIARVKRHFGVEE